MNTYYPAPRQQHAPQENVPLQAHPETPSHDRPGSVGPNDFHQTQQQQHQNTLSLNMPFRVVRINFFNEQEPKSYR